MAFHALVSFLDYFSTMCSEFSHRCEVDMFTNLLRSEL